MEEHFKGDPIPSEDREFFSRIFHCLLPHKADNVSNKSNLFNPPHWRYNRPGGWFSFSPMEKSFPCPFPASSSVLEKCLPRSTVRSIFPDHPARRTECYRILFLHDQMSHAASFANDAFVPVRHTLRPRRSTLSNFLQGNARGSSIMMKDERACSSATLLSFFPYSTFTRSCQINLFLN